MPLGPDVGKNIEELYADNKRKGRARGANGTPRSRKQIIAIAEEEARRKGGGTPRPKKTVLPKYRA